MEESAAPASQSATPAETVRHRLEFTGDGGTYFGIWIVNILLTIVTLGIYSPWAKVRRLRYFYGNTLLDGSPFEFHGSPIAILKGRIIGLVLLVAYSQSSKVSFTLWVVVAGGIALALPWILWRSLRFRLANSSYRGIRFAFDGTLREAYLVFLLPILAFMAPVGIQFLTQAGAASSGPPSPAKLFVNFLVLVGIALAIGPWLYLRVKRYQHSRVCLGVTRFGFTAEVADAYGLMAMLFGIALLAIVCASFMGFVAGFVLNLMHGNAAVIGISVVVFYLSFLSLLPFMQAFTQNFVWDHTTLGGQAISSEAGGFALWKIGASNLFFLIITLGFYWPYALVRQTRYKLSVLSWTGDPAALVSSAADAPVGAMGEETADLFGFDLAL